MKKSKIIIAIILILSIILAASNVFAETSVSWAKASYDQTGSVNETKVANISFQNATDNIGVVSGTINFNKEYIQVISVEKNDWALTYNEANGRFNTVKSTGAGFGSLMKITYKIIKEVNSDTNIISISDIKYTSTRYETYLEANTLNLKMIKGSSTEPSNTTNNTNTSNVTHPTNNTNTSNSTNPSNNTNPSNATNPSNNIDNSSSGNVYNNVNTNTNNSKTNTNGNTNKPNKQNTTNGEDTTTSKAGLPYTGLVGNSLKFLLIGAFVVVLTIRYFVKYKKIDVE